MTGEKGNLTKGIIYGCMAGVLWGTLGIFLMLLLDAGMSDVAVSSVGPTIVIVFYGITGLIRNRRSFAIGWRRVGILLIGGGIANAALYYSYSKALGYLSTGVFSILEFSHVFVLMLLSAFIFKYKITKGKLASLGLAAIGLILVLDVFTPGAYIKTAGILWMALNWLANCAVALIIKWALNKEIDNNVVIVYYNLGAALIYWVAYSPVKAFGEIAAAESVGKLIMIILAYGLCTQILSSYVWVKSFSLVDPAITNMMNAFAPITAAILGYFILGQVISPMQILGIGVIIAAVVLLNKTSPPEEA